MFCRCMAVDLSAKHLRFNCVSPGVVAAGSALKVYNEDEGYRKLVEALIPGGKLTPPEAIAATVHFLASEAASCYQGQILSPDSGISLPMLCGAGS